MHRVRLALLQLAVDDATLRTRVVPLTRQAEKWDKLPKGWTQESVEKFWESMTGDNKHKVTKCIKEMGGNIDEPGAFCASLADKVMGTDWRKGPRNKQGGQAQTPNLIDTAAARFRDRMEASINESYRTNQPALIPPTLNLLHGQHYMRLVISDGDLKRDALAFISRDTGQVYLAGGWDQPLPFPVANVLEVGTWGTRTAFDQYNVPELLAQLKSVLLKKGLEDVWDEVRQKGIPRLINEAWMSLSKKDRKRRADLIRLAGRGRGRTVVGADIRKVLAQLFLLHKPYVKDWGRFIKEVASDLLIWPVEWASGIVGFDTSEGETTTYEWTGDQIGGGWDNPPEYEENSVDVARSVNLVFGSELNLRTFPMMFTKSFRTLVTDAKGFQLASLDLVNSQQSVVMLGKLLMAGLKNYIKSDPAGAVENSDAWQFVEEAAGDTGFTDWDVSYKLDDVQVKRSQFKVMGSYLRVWVDADVYLSVTNVIPPEPFFDEDDYTKGRWARLQELRARRA